MGALLIYGTVCVACNRQHHGCISTNEPANSPELDKCVRKCYAYIVGLHLNRPGIHRGALHASRGDSNDLSYAPFILGMEQGRRDSGTNDAD